MLFFSFIGGYTSDQRNPYGIDFQTNRRAGNEFTAYFLNPKKWITKFSQALYIANRFTLSTFIDFFDQYGYQHECYKI